MTDGMSEGYRMADEAMQETKCLMATLIEYFSQEEYRTRYEELLTKLKYWLESEGDYVNNQAIKHAKERASALKWDGESKNLPSTQSAWASLYNDIFHSELIRYNIFSILQEVSPLRIKTVLAFGRICSKGKLLYAGDSKDIFRLWMEEVP